MSKKTFDINSLFNVRRFDKCLEEVLETVVKEEALDQQDVMDIVELSAKHYQETVKYFTGRKNGSTHAHQFGAPRFPGQPFVGGFAQQMGYSSYGPAQYQSYLGKDHPEFFAQLFTLAAFQITYHDTVLSDNFNFVGVDGDSLTYLGRDKELAKVAGNVVFHQGRLEVNLDCLLLSGMVRIQPTADSDLLLRDAMQNGTLPLPGLTATSPATRELMAHIRNHGWRDLDEGDLVVQVDNPEQVYLMGLRSVEVSKCQQVMVIPVEITESPEGLVATPQTHLGIQTLDLMLLKRYKHQA